MASTVYTLHKYKITNNRVINDQINNENDKSPNISAFAMLKSGINSIRGRLMK